MSGEKMKLVIATLNYLLTILNENDRLSIVIFDDTVQRLNPLQRMNKQNIDSLKEKINKISAELKILLYINIFNKNLLKKIFLRESNGLVGEREGGRGVNKLFY